MPTTAKPKKKTKRISAEVALRLHTRIERAAAKREVSLSHFVAEAVARFADEVLEDSHRNKLTNEDAEFLINLMENPPPVNDRLLEAIRASKRYTRG